MFKKALYYSNHRNKFDIMKMLSKEKTFKESFAFIL